MCAATLYSSSSGSCNQVYHQYLVLYCRSKLTNLGKLELQWVVRAQANIEPRLEEVRQRISFIRKEESIVAQRAHSNADLFEVEQVL